MSSLDFNIAEVFKDFDTKDIVYKFDPNWGADVTGSKYLLLDSLKPYVDFKYSKSHCPNLGGFFAINPETKTNVGLDIEQTDNITFNVVRRIYPKATEENCKATWVALEASFKGLRGFKQPQTLSQILLGPFQKVADNIQTFSLENPQVYGLKNSKGIVFGGKTHQICFFICC